VIWGGGTAPLPHDSVKRAMALWPNKGEPDGRPELGEPYSPIEPSPPARPVVPEAAPGALRLPVTPV